MRRWATFIGFIWLAILGLFVSSGVSAGVKARGLAQSTVVTTPVVVTAQAGTGVTTTASPDGSGSAPSTALVLTPGDSGGTFTVLVGSQIILMIPRLPTIQLSFDPGVLQLIDGRPEPLPPAPPVGLSDDPSMNPPNSGGIAVGGWHLIAIGPGVSPLSVVNIPCNKPPCPQMPSISFGVTIIVRGNGNTTPGGAETYIGTAFLDKTVVVSVGGVVRLDLPYLSQQQSIQLQFNPKVLQPLAGQDLTHVQRNGWRFLVIGPGASQIVVLATICANDYGEGTTCTPKVVFQVTVTTTQASP